MSARTGRGSIAAASMPAELPLDAGAKAAAERIADQQRPVSTAEPTATPSSTARLPRQWYARLRTTRRGT